MSSEQPSPYEAPKTTPAETPRAGACLRLWPGFLTLAVVVVPLMLLGVYQPEDPGTLMPIVFVVAGGYLGWVVWWLLLSRAPWRDRLGAIALTVAGVAIGLLGGYHETITGMNGFMPLVFALMPWLLGAVMVALLLTRPLGWPAARAVATVAALACLVGFASVRLDSNNSAFQFQFAPRWQSSNEERLLAEIEGREAATQPDAGEAAAEVDFGDPVWPGFRGPARDGRVKPGSLAGDWNTSAPTERWRIAIGPGWGSFCVVGDWLFTQEQRGENECVVAYDATTGQQRWENRVAARFYESIAGPGPRGTPTFFEGRLYTTGAEGDVQCLDAATGQTLWKRRLLAGREAGGDSPPLTSRKGAPEWGFASSPLILTPPGGKTLALVIAGDPRPNSETGVEGEAVIALDADSGEVAWKGGVGFHSYSSPHLATLGGAEQVLSLTNFGLESLDPETGERLWFLDWDLGPYGRSIQPSVIDGGQVLMAAGYGSGAMLVNVAANGEKWSATEAWQQPSRDLLPYFNDMVLYEGHLYGISEKFLVCINAETGESVWPRKVKRKSKVGNGQIVLDPESGALLVTHETTGEVLLIEATPKTLNVLNRFQALPAETTWNHPVVADGKLYVRNGIEAACYELPVGEQ